MIDIVGRRGWWFLLSLVVLIPAVISLAVFGLKPSIDFQGGTLWELEFSRPVQPAEVQGIFAEKGFADSAVQTAILPSGQQTVVVRSQQIGSDETKQAILATLTERFGEVQLLRFESVGPIVAGEVIQRAQVAVVLAALGILTYISWAFRKVTRPFRYGACAVVAIVHDILIVVGIFSLLGHFLDIEVDALFVTAVLTVIGFSVHDTIVVFDRIRENLARRTGESFEQVVNYSLMQTLTRSLTTSLTVVFTLLALYLFGGVTVKNFVLALLIGIISGTYSSIFNASLLLVVWENGDVRRVMGRVTGRAAA